MFFTKVVALIACAVTSVVALNATYSNSTNPSRYLQASIYRQGPANNPAVGYYWITLCFGRYPAQVIVDSGISRNNGIDFREW
jgi:hypothetical protein